MNWLPLSNTRMLSISNDEKKLLKTSLTYSLSCSYPFFTVGNYLHNIIKSINRTSIVNVCALCRFIEDSQWWTVTLQVLLATFWHRIQFFVVFSISVSRNSRGYHTFMIELTLSCEQFPRVVPSMFDRNNTTVRSQQNVPTILEQKSTLNRDR